MISGPSWTLALANVDDDGKGTGRVVFKVEFQASRILDVLFWIIRQANQRAAIWVLLVSSDVLNKLVSDFLVLVVLPRDLRFKNYPLLLQKEIHP